MAQKTKTRKKMLDDSNTSDKASDSANGIVSSIMHLPLQTNPQEKLTSSLTFITSEGESITFPDLQMPPGDMTAISSEDVLAKIWNRQAEESAWRDM